MSASLKKTLFACYFIMTSSSYINSAPMYDRARLDYWLTVVHYSLEGVPEHEIDTIKRRVQQEIQRQDLNNEQLMTTLIHKALIDHVRQEAYNELARLSQQGKFLDRQEQDKIANDFANNFTHQINGMRNIEGKQILSFFGKGRVQAIESIVNYTIQWRGKLNSSSYPTSDLQMPPIIPNTGPNYGNSREYCAQQHAQAIGQQLKGVISDAHIQRLQILVMDSTHYLTTVPEDDRKSLVKYGLAQLLDERLNAYHIQLQPWVTNKKKLADSVTTTRQKGIAIIESSAGLDPEKIRSLFGECGGRNCIEESIIRNMGISCPICYEEFKQEMLNGTADRVILKGQDRNKPCGHAVCKRCVKSCNNICPECRAQIDKKDLDDKMKK